MVIVWVDIWNVQSGSKTKSLINRCFNIRNNIATIRGANMNLGMPQCKNHWRWGHTIFSCRIQGAKYIKCNRPHKLEYHQCFTQYYKANEKSNLSYLETKKSKLCLHTFKYSNCQDDHQADSNQYLFWKYHFNCEQHNKKIIEICENRKTSICLAVSSSQAQI